MTQTTLLLDGLVAPEGPRWHDGRLWFSDMRTHKVMSVDLAGRAETVVEVPEQPSGLGWLPDGRLLVVSMHDRRLLRLDPGGLTEVANLWSLASYHCNDMVVDAQGRAYIGNFGFDYKANPPVLKLAEVILATPDGSARIVADELAFPNGMVITPDGRTLIVAESAAARLTAFAIEPDGSLAQRRIWAQFDQLGPGLFAKGRVLPDGIALDAEGAIWVASPASQEVLRVREGGEVTQRIRPSASPLACMLGGPHRQTLFMCIPESDRPDAAGGRQSGRIEMVEADVAGAGYP